MKLVSAALDLKPDSKLFVVILVHSTVVKGVLK